MVQRVDDIRLVILTMFGKVGIKITLLDQHGQHRILLGLGGGFEFLGRAGQQAQTLTNLDVLVFQVTGGRRQIMRIHGGQCIRTPLGGGAEHAVALLEPFNGATENTVARQGIGHMVRHHAEVLTYDHAAGARGLDGQNAQHDV